MPREKTYLCLHTEAPTRQVLARHRPGRLVLATDEVVDEDREVYDDVVLLPPAWEAEETLRRLRAVPADVVIAQAEYGLLPGALLARERGIPGPDPWASFLATNKWRSRVALAEAGVPQPRFALCSSAADVRAADLGYPVVLKAVASTLGRLVRRVERPEDLGDAVRDLLRGVPSAPDVRRCVAYARLAGWDMACDPLRQFLAESYADGPPVETDGLVFGTRVDLFGVTEQVVSAPPRFYVEGYLFPARLDGPRAARIEEISRAALRALGIRDSGFSIELRGEVVIEVNGRLGEDEGFPELFAAGLGQAPMLRWLEPEAAPSSVRGAHALAYLCRYEPGVVTSVRGAEGAHLLVGPGERIHVPGTPEFHPHLAYALASHPDDVRAAYAEARRRVGAVDVRFEEPSR